MTPERWQRIEQIFQSVLDHPDNETSSLLDRLCADDTELRRDVESLLMEHRQSPLSIGQLVSNATELMHAAEPIAPAGKRIGSYRILSVIGQGGMGVVYEAVRDDDQYRKKVALKIMKRGALSDQIVQRFKQERQILASLEHPNIARLLDGGTTEEGLPYFVMEHIQGMQLLEHCDSKNSSIPERLRLFVKICSAVQYAHQKLVIHRDIKPSNILVDAEGSPKLLDFGIAKLLNADPEVGMPTATMTLLRMMTPEYASPEQVRGLPVSTSTDVYSLGAVLFELLTGRKAHQFQTYTPTEIERVVCLSETQKPSVAVAGSKTMPPRISKMLRGDLDNIVLMSMRKEPERRYQSALQLNEDIERYLNGLPIHARPDTLGYRAGKFARRHRVAVIAGLIVLVSLLTGIIYANYQARRAERRFEQVRRLANSFLFDFHEKIKDLPGSTEAREMIVRTALEYLDSLSQDAKNDASLQLELSEAYQKVGDVQGDPRAGNLGHPEAAIKSYQKALALSERLVRKDPDNLRILFSLATCYNKVGDLQVETGDIKGGMLTLKKGIAVDEKIESKHRMGQPELLLFVRTLRLLGDAQLKARSITEALATQKRALSLSERMAREFPGDFSQHHLAWTLVRVGGAYVENGNLAAGIDCYKKVLQIRGDLTVRNPTDQTNWREYRLIHTWLGNYYGGRSNISMEEQQTAIEYYRKALEIAEKLASMDTKNAQLKHDLSICYANLADLSTSDDKEAIRLYEKAIEVNSTLMANSPGEFRFLSRYSLYARNIAAPYRRLGNMEKAAYYLNASLNTLSELQERSGENDEVRSGLYSTQLALGDLSLDRGKYAEAENHFKQALAIASQSNSESPNDLYALWHLADSYEAVGKYYSAIALNTNESTERQTFTDQGCAAYEKSHQIWMDWQKRAISTKFDRLRLERTGRLLMDCRNRTDSSKQS